MCGRYALHANPEVLALQFGLASMGAALRGTGIAKPTMVVQMLSVVLNVVLAPVLIAGWGTGRPLGVLGAGLASTIAVAASIVALGAYFVVLEKYVAWDRALVRPRAATWRRILAIGVPAGGEFMLMFLFMGVTYWVIRGFGPDAQAGLAFLQANGYNADDTTLFVATALQRYATLNTTTFDAAMADLQNVENLYDLEGASDDPLYTFNVNRPINQEEARIHGWEIGGQYFFGDSGFGVLANYTKVNGDVAFDDAGPTNVDQFALTGLSDTANAVLMFEKFGISVRLAWNWRDEFLSAANLGSKLNGLLTLFDAAGREVADSNDFDDGADPLVALRVPRDGRYLVRISDLALDASGEHFYRLSIGPFAYVTGGYPLAVAANAESELSLAGFNLPADVSVRVKAGAPGQGRLRIVASTWIQ